MDMLKPFLLFFFFFSPISHVKPTVISPLESHYHLRTSKAGLEFENTRNEDSLTVNRARMTTVVSGVSAIYIGYMSYLQYVWYKDHERVPFHYYNDAKGYNQIDKLGHVYGSYMLSYMGYKSLVWAGMERNKAALYGGGMGFLMQLPIEIWDGMYEGWGFSWSDVAANGVGSALMLAQELMFQEQLVHYKFTFRPTIYARQANGYLGEGFSQLLNDYNGHTYWLSMGVKRIIKNPHIPNWLNFAIGYSAGGMFGEFENKMSHRGVLIPETERYRQFLFSLDIDFSKIPVKSRFLSGLFNYMFVLKVPFPTIEFNTKGEMRFHPLYF
jgi:uncharacterized protein YfiM (DUF2279 family)